MQDNPNDTPVRAEGAAEGQNETQGRHGQNRRGHHGQNRRGGHRSSQNRKPAAEEALAEAREVMEERETARETRAAVREPSAAPADSAKGRDRGKGQRQNRQNGQNGSGQNAQNGNAQNRRPQGQAKDGAPRAASEGRENGQRPQKQNRSGEGMPREDASLNNPNSQNPQQNGQRRQRGDRTGAGQQDRRQNRPDGQQPRKNRDRRDRRDAKQTAEPQEEPKTPETFSESFLPPRKAESFLGFASEDDSVLDSMPPDPTLDAVFSEPAPAAPAPAEGVEIVGIHFPQGGKVYYFDPAGAVFEEGSFAVVETARGQELGEVAIANRRVPESEIVQPLKPVIRRAAKEDLEHQKANIAREADALAICKKKVESHRLDMKLTGAQYTFDNAKLIFYFTAAQRVDFRELVKDLASTFRTRIELRQIGARDEAKMIGGCGVCGRKLCCSAFLPNYAQVSIKMAKHQGLALNSAKISGNCGRLMCCLKYEESTYERELALMPTVDSLVETPDGRGTVTDVRPVGYTVRVKLDDKPDAAPKQFRLEEIRILVRAAEKTDDEGDDRGDAN